MTGATTRVPVASLQFPTGTGAGLTHRGCVRDRNEDSILTDPSGKLWAVSDGMGGYGNGEEASDIVIECLARIPDTAAPAEALGAEIGNANRRILERAGGEGRMGATVVAAIVARAMLHLAWVGDSRAYLWRGGALRLLTHDHTVVQDLVDRGEIDAEDAARHPESHVVTRAVGGADVAEPDFAEIPLFRGDRLLLCSDGLTRTMSDQDIAESLATDRSPEEMCRALMHTALEAGAPDNVSVIVIRMRDD